MAQDETELELTIRPVRDADAEGLIAMIEACFHEYPGCVMDLGDLDKDLLAIATNTAAQDGEFWVAERSDGPGGQGGTIVGSGGYAPHKSNLGDMVEVKRLYVSRLGRRQGLATRFLRLIEEAAASRRVQAIDLWSDTRFLEGHAFYEAHGFRQTGASRDLHDPSNTTEYHFIRAQP